eukprot:TRINITY_DN6876_c0_g2_i1.p1 TRINITY_DN6876_c0_g2~~TRINITY_DN6876_c0_g2_i1.p1  ORF type:complete len:125 (+),score=17.56 TRINITY_DN6876_c0_g2_i1:80-454(+)
MAAGTPMTTELGSESTAWATTFSLTEEDHTIGNAVRYVLNQDPRTSFCGYSVPHPSESRVNIRLQTTGDPARVVFRDALGDIMAICEHVKSKFTSAVEEFVVKEGVEKSVDEGIQDDDVEMTGA